MLQKILVQASSRSWSGGKDRSVSHVAGEPVVVKTLKKLRVLLPDVKIEIIAPAFDEGGELSTIKSMIENCEISYSHNDSPFERINQAVSALDNGFVLRIDALNFCFKEEALIEVIKLMGGGMYDSIRFEDDYPAQLTFEVYKIEAIKKLKVFFDENLLDAKYKIQSKFAYSLLHQDFQVINYKAKLIPDEELVLIREKMQELYNVDRIEVGKNYIPAGDQIRFHYENAKKWLKSTDVVLDIACGNGFGAEILSLSVSKVIGGDLDSEIIEETIKKNRLPSNVTLQVEDVLKMTFESETFDVVTSMETIEHLKPYFDNYLKEIKRVLKVNGKIIISTPQNGLGHIPLNAAHGIEFNRDELVELVQKYFKIEEVISIKAGCIVHPLENKGNNMMVVASKI